MNEYREWVLEQVSGGEDKIFTIIKIVKKVNGRKL